MDHHAEVQIFILNFNEQVFLLYLPPAFTVQYCTVPEQIVSFL